MQFSLKINCRVNIGEQSTEMETINAFWLEIVTHNNFLAFVIKYPAENYFSGMLKAAIFRHNIKM